MKSERRRQQYEEKELRRRDRKVNTKQVIDYKSGVPELKPLNEKQADYIHLLRTMDMVIATGLAGTSKAQPLYSRVLTPKGWRTMGDLEAGDKVITPANKQATIISTHPFHSKPVYELTTKSGAKTRACIDHLWKVKVRKEKCKSEYKVVNTQYMLDNPHLIFSLPLNKGVGTTQDKELPIEPYVMGLLLSEGHFGNRVTISNGDSEIIESLKSFCGDNDLVLKRLGGYDYAFNMKEPLIGNQVTGIVNPLKRKLKDLGLLGVKSGGKFIPECYIESSVEQRLHLLQGLMDGDESAPTPRKNGSSASLTTISPVLAEQFLYLARSLGMKASLSENKSGYRKDGVLKECSTAYTVGLAYIKPKDIFRLTRKRNNMQEVFANGRVELVDKIESINFVGNEDVKCILLDDEDHLYLTDDFIVTHNTYIPTVMACDDLKCGKVDKIYLTRPNISNSKSLGFFGGDLVEKMTNWLLPVLSIMNDRLGAGAVECHIKNGNIAFVPLETIKGASFNKAWVICDEAEDLSYDEVKKVSTRIGDDVKFVLAGDISQSELKEHSGLKKLINVVGNWDSLKSRVGHVDFNRPSDIVRSDLCRELILAFRHEEGKED